MRAVRFELIIRGGEVMTPTGLVTADLGVSSGRIAGVGIAGSAEAETVIDARGLTVLPGVIDSQVHFREPGMEHKEDLESGTRSAVAGGVTAIFEMPNTKPLTVTEAAFRDKLVRAQGRSWCDYGFFFGGTGANAAELPRHERLPGCAGIKIFMGSSTGDLLCDTEACVEAVLRHGTRRVSVHAEDEARLKERFGLVRDGAPVSQHPVWRDPEAAVIATRRLIRLAKAAGRKVHILHISTAEELPLLAADKDLVTCEVTPQHLTLTAPDCYDQLGSKAQMNPPLRDQSHADALWRAVRDGMFDVMGSDHAPHTLAEKAQAYPGSPSGMTGVQTLLPVMLDHVAAGRLSLERLADLTAHGPQRIFGIAGKGRIVPGYDADLVLVDRKAERVIDDTWIESKAGWTPYHGRRVTGWPMATIVRGRVVMREGALFGPPTGQPVRF